MAAIKSTKSQLQKKQAKFYSTWYISLRNKTFKYNYFINNVKMHDWKSIISNIIYYCYNYNEFKKNVNKIYLPKNLSYFINLILSPLKFV